MNYFSSNLKYLRKQKGLNQTDFARKIGTNRPKIGSYEEGRAEPNLETLQNVSHFFKVKLDDLIEKDLSKDKQKSNKDFTGNDLRILPIVVNEEQEEKISLVPVKAAAGYLNGYADSEFIEQLPSFNLPFTQLSQGTHRAFQIKGDSMLPIPSESYILTEYLENWNWLKSGECYVIVSKNDGVVYKRVVNQFEENQSLELHSDNPSYETYTIEGRELLEIWRAVGFVSFDLPSPIAADPSIGELKSMMHELKAEVERLKK
ncbi:MAG: LexA family transcriptional regulator [Vicingaceae bacterium]